MTALLSFFRKCGLNKHQWRRLKTVEQSMRQGCESRVINRLSYEIGQALLCNVIAETFDKIQDRRHKGGGMKRGQKQTLRKDKCDPEDRNFRLCLLGRC